MEEKINRIRKEAPMSREVHEKRLLRLLKSEVVQQPIPEEELAELFSGMTLADWSRVTELAAANRLCPILFGALVRNTALKIPMQMGQYLRNVTMRSSMAFYQKFALASELLKRMEREKVHGCVLKGISLSALYPVPEGRAFSDIDLYIPDPEEFRRFTASLEAEGFKRNQEDRTDYHVSYRFVHNGVGCEIEIHYRLTTTWGKKKFDAKLDENYDQGIEMEEGTTISLMGVALPALPVTLDALYLLMHLFQHFMNKGFGIRLLLDWTIFWNQKGAEVDVEQFRQWIHSLGLEYFLDVINWICTEYLGMAPPVFGALQAEPCQNLAESLLDDVLAGGEFGSQDKSRIVVPSFKAGIRGFFLELHRQTKRHYPRASRIPVLLPLLWVMAALSFQINNLFRRRVSLRNVLKSSSSRNRLAQKLKVFEE